MSAPPIYCWRSLLLLFLLGGQICLITNHAEAAAAAQPPRWQQLQKPGLVAEEEPVIVINSRHSAKAPAPLLQERRDNRQKQQPLRVTQSASSAGQPSQEFDSINNLIQTTNGPIKAAPAAALQVTTRRQSASSLIRDTSELFATNNQYELEQRRAAPAASTSTTTTTTTTTTESWMQSVRDNHHGPIRSRFNLNHRQQSPSVQQQSSADWLGLAGKRAVPIGDTNQLVLDGHMKPGVSQPVPYEQQNLIKSVRTAEQSATTTAATPATHRRNSKFTRRSTEFLDDSPSSSDPSTTTPVYQTPSRTGAEISWRDLGHNKTSSSKVADFKTILMSNNHRPMSGVKPKERRPNRSGRSLTNATESVDLKAESRQQPKGWSRLFRTLGSVLRRITNTTAAAAPPTVGHGFAAMQNQQFNSFAAPPSVASPTTNFQHQQQQQPGVMNYIASALSAALSAAANRPPKAPSVEEDHYLPAPVLDFSNPIGANSMRHETREPGLRQHANKKIIDSFVDLPVSERRSGSRSSIKKRNGLEAPSNSSRKARTIASADQDFELEPATADAAAGKGNGSWSAAEPSADFYLGANLTEEASHEEEEPTTTAEPLVEPEEDQEQLDFRTTTDATAANDGEGSDSVEGSETAAEDEGEQLEAADSIIVPERMAHEVAHDLGEPVQSHQQQQQQDDASLDDEEDNTFASSEDLGEGFSLFYAPAPGDLLQQAKNYRKESESFDSTDETGEGSFARITPVSNHQRPRKPQHTSTRHKNTIRRPQLTPIEPAPFHSDEDASEEDEHPMRGGMTFMMIPSRVRPDRRRPSTANRRRPPSAQLAVPAISLKDTRRPVATSTGSRNRNKPATSSRPLPAGGVFNSPKVHDQPKSGQDMLSPMSSSISVMDLDPSMTRLAHNKLIVAKFKPKFKQQPSKKPLSQNQNLLHRSSASEQPVRKQQPLSLSSALLASSNDNANNLNELVSRRWQMKPRSSASTTTTTTTEAANLLARDPSGETTTTTTTTTARSIQEQDSSLPRIASDFQFLMPGLASGLAARISSLTRPHTSTSTSTSAPPSSPDQASPSNQEPSRETPPSSYAGDTPAQSSQSSQSYGGNRNDKFNFSLMSMNNRERINPLLFPVERFSNSSSYSVQQQQKEQQKNKPANHRSRVTTSTQRPTTTTTSTTTTTTTAPVTRQQMNVVTSSELPLTTPSRPRTSQRPRSTTTTTTVRPIRTTTTTQKATTPKDTGEDDSTIGQIVRNQHHHHTTSYTRPAARPNRPLTESERLRNQYLAMIGKNASLDGRIWQTESPSAIETTVSTGSPLGHMSLVEATHDANKYTTLDAAPPTATNEDEDPSLGIVILSDNHHNRRPSSSSIRRNGVQPQPTTRLPPFSASHTKYELASKPGLQPDTARKYLEEFVNGTRVRPSSMSKLVTSTQVNNTSTGNRRNQPTAFNSVQGSPPSPMLNGEPLMGKLDLRAQELLLGAVFDGDNLNQPSRSFHQQQNSTSADDMDRMKTQSTITLTPVPITSTSTTTATASEETTTTQAQTPAPVGEPERGPMDLGESGDLNNRASMRKNQAKIQSILLALANKNKSQSHTSTTTQAPAASNSDDSDESSEQDFKTTLADYSPSTSGTEEDLMETTRFYAPIKLTTRSSYFRPPMSTPAPGRGGAYPNIETNGSRQKINRPALAAGNDSSANFEYSPAMPASATPPRNEMPTTKLTESLASDQLRQTIRDRIGGGSIYSATSEYSSPTSTTLAMDAENNGQTADTTTAASPTDESATTAEPTATTEASMAESTHASDGEDSTNEISNRRRPTPAAEADYPEMPAFPQTRPPPRPVIIRRRPTKRPPPQHLAIGQSGEDVAVATSKPRRKKRPTKRPAATQDADDSGGSSQKRKIIYRPVQVSGGSDPLAGDSPVLIRKRPGGYIRPPDNIHIHPAPSPMGDGQPIRIRNSTYRPTSVTAPVSIMLPSSMETLHLKKKDHDIRTRPLTIMDPASSSSSSSSGDHLTDENILSPAILTRIPETTIMHDKMLVSYKPGRPLPGSMSSFGSMGRPAAKPHHHDRQPAPDSGLDSTSSLVDSLISSITTSVAPTSSSSNSSSTSYTARPPQLGSGNGGDTHLISIEQQQRERQTTRQPPQTQTPAPPTSTTVSSSSSSSSLTDTTAFSNTSSQSSTNYTATAHRPIIVINGLFGNDDHQHQQPPKTNNNDQQHHNKRPNASLGSNSLLEAGSLSVVAQASHGQANSSRPWYPTAAVSGWPSKQNSSSTSSQGQDHSLDSSASSNSTLSDLSSSSSTSIEQSVFGGSEMPNFGSPSSSQPSGSYQNHQLQNQQQPIGMPYQITGGGGAGSRPGQRPQANRPWRVRRRPSGNASPTGSGSGTSNAGYNFSSASSVSNYVYRPLLSSVSSFGVLFDNVQIFFARIRTFIISLMVMFLPPLALAFSVVQAMSA